MKFRVSFFYGNGGKWIHTDHLYHKRYMLMKKEQHEDGKMRSRERNPKRQT